MSKIKFGVKNLKYAKLTYGVNDAETYGSFVNIPGAKSISLQAAGETFTEYAEDGVWYQASNNNGYTGNINVEELPLSFFKDIFGMVEDTAGALFESAADAQAEFALAGEFTFAGDTETGKRFCLFRCTATRPDIVGTGKTDTITVDTDTLNITVLPRKSDKMVKASTTSGETAYATWFSAVPTKQS